MEALDTDHAVKNVLFLQLPFIRLRVDLAVGQVFFPQLGEVGAHHVQPHLIQAGVVLGAGQGSHQALGGHMGGAQGQASDIEITAREIQKLKKELYCIIAEHSHTDYDKVWADSDRDYWMTSQEALEYGMIDRIFTKNEKA